MRHVHYEQLVKVPRVEEREMLDSYKGSAVLITLGRVLVVVVVMQPLQKRQLFTFVWAS